MYCANRNTKIQYVQFGGEEGGVLHDFKEGKTCKYVGR